MRPTITRANALKAALLVSFHSAPLVPSIATAVYIQADDKSFDMTLPDTWQGQPLTRGTPPQLFSLSSMRRDASLDLTVDIADASDWGKKFAPKRLTEIDIKEVGDRLCSQQPQPAMLLQADKVAAGANGLFSLAMYVLRYKHIEGQTIVALALAQGRAFRLTLQLPAEPDAALLAEAESILKSYRAFPLNAGCLAASNKGQKALPGVCY